MAAESAFASKSRESIKITRVSDAMLASGQG